MTSNQSILKNLAKIDTVMSAVIKKVGPIDLKPRRLPPFQSIIHSIIHQQLSGHVAGAIYNRFVSLFGKGKFPTPEQIKEIDFEIMRGAGLSKPKTVY